MNARQAIQLGIDMAHFVAMGYLEDLTDADLLLRPCPGCNHINWQVGHLIVSEYQHRAISAPSAVAPLPPGIAEKYTYETAKLDDPAAFCTKAELLAAAKVQRDATLAALELLTDADLDRDSGVHYAPTVGALLSLQGSHWMMHAGQWAVVRRQLGKPPLF